MNQNSVGKKRERQRGEWKESEKAGNIEPDNYHHLEPCVQQSHTLVI